MLCLAPSACQVGTMLWMGVKDNVRTFSHSWAIASLFSFLVILPQNQDVSPIKDRLKQAKKNMYTPSDLRS